MYSQFLQGMSVTLSLKENVFCANVLCESFLDVVLKLRDGLYFIPRESRGESHFLLSAWNPLGISDSTTHGHNNSRFFFIISLPVLQRTLHWYSDLFNIFVMWFGVIIPFSSLVFLSQLWIMYLARNLVTIDINKRTLCIVHKKYVQT